MLGELLDSINAMTPLELTPEECRAWVGLRRKAEAAVSAVEANADAGGSEARSP